MKRPSSSRVCARLLLSGALLGASSASALAQESPPPRTEAEAQVSSQLRAYEQAMATRTALKVEEYGRAGHCYLTAVLDNLAVLVQADPKLKAYVVTRTPAGVGADEARYHLNRARYYLTQERGLARERVVAVHGGSGQGSEVMTELWVVPDGAQPPVRPPDEALAGKEFEGMLDSYATDGNVFREEVEMGWPSYAVAFSDFADTLKRQPQSVGYVVVRPAKNSLPGEWRRIARRDEFILQNDYGVAPERLKSVNGGPSDADSTTVELWVRPKSAPPPAGAKEEPRGPLKEAARLNSLQLSDTPDEEVERWVVENLGELLRADAKARGVIIVRPYAPDETEEGEAQEESGAEEEPEADRAGEAPKDAPGQATSAAPAEAAGEAGEADAQAEDEPAERDALAVAEEWRKLLAEKYGVEPHRLLVLVGHTQAWNSGRLDTWVVPAEAALPDPFAVTRDEDEEAPAAEGEEVAAGQQESAPPPFMK